MHTTKLLDFYTVALAILANLSLAGSVSAAPPGGMMHPGMNPENAEQMMEYRQNYMGGGQGWMGSMMGGGYGWGGGFGMGMGAAGCGYGPGGGHMGGRGPMMGICMVLICQKNKSKKCVVLGKNSAKKIFT